MSDTRFIYYVSRGRFYLSPAMLLRLWEIGTPEIGTPLDEVFEMPKHKDRREEAFRRWSDFLDYSQGRALPEGRELVLPLQHVFTADHEHVLSFHSFDLFGGERLARHDPRLHRVVSELRRDDNWGSQWLSWIPVPAGTRYRIVSVGGREGERVFFHEDGDWVVAT